MISAVCVGLLMAAALHGSDVPARIVNPTAEGRAVLERAVRTALNGVKVTLAEDALTAQSTLILERTVRRDANGLRIQGRELSRPEEFQLVKSGGACVLGHARPGRRTPLEHTECVEDG